MKKLITITMLLASVFHFNADAQEKYGRTLNLGLGAGGYGGYYAGHYARPLPVFHIDYEFDVAKNFTLAPFANFSTYSDEYWWGDPQNPARFYAYHETVIPVGVKGTYYFDDLLKANPKWDFYLAGSLGFVIVNSSWENGYYGNRYYFHDPSYVFLDLHIGAEYHFNDHLGAFLDLSTGVSTIGLAIHGSKK